MIGIRKLVAVGLGCVLFSACSDTGYDGYAFERQDFERSQVTVTVVQFDQRRDFEAKAADLGIDAKKARALGAFGEVQVNEPTCTVYVMRIPDNYAPEYIGHEFVHCLYGRFHGP